MRSVELFIWDIYSQVILWIVKLITEYTDCLNFWKYAHNHFLTVCGWQRFLILKKLVFFHLHLNRAHNPISIIHKDKFISVSLKSGYKRAKHLQSFLSSRAHTFDLKDEYMTFNKATKYLLLTGTGLRGMYK